MTMKTIPFVNSFDGSTMYADVPEDTPEDILDGVIMLQLSRRMPLNAALLAMAKRAAHEYHQRTGMPVPPERHCVHLDFSSGYPNLV